MISVLLPIVLFAFVIVVALAAVIVLGRRFEPADPPDIAVQPPAGGLRLPTDPTAGSMQPYNLDHVMPSVVWLMLQVATMFLYLWAVASAAQGAAYSVFFLPVVSLVVGILYVRQRSVTVAGESPNESADRSEDG